MNEQITVFESEGFDALITVAFDSLTGATTLVGGTVAVDALNLSTSVKTTGTATVASATTVRATFAAWVLAAGKYSVQVRARPAGYTQQDVGYCTLTVLPAAAASGNVI